MTAFWNAGKNAKSPALWNHLLEPPLRQMKQPIQSKLDYRLDLAVSMDMLVWVTKPVLLFLWWNLKASKWCDADEPTKPKSKPAAVWRWFNQHCIPSKTMFKMNHVVIYYEFILLKMALL
jgi:hypothetical protein